MSYRRNQKCNLAEVIYGGQDTEDWLYNSPELVTYSPNGRVSSGAK
jgi:hypothetical protein